MTECEEVAANMDTTGIRSWSDAAAYVRRTMRSPDDVGFQIFDNVCDALLARATAPA